MTYNFQEIPILQTNRITLREATLKDINSVFELRSSQEINKFVGTKKIKTLTEAKAFILDCKNLFKEEKRIFWLIEFKNKVIGSVVLHKIDVAKHYAEIGYKLKPEYQQKGIMTEVLESVIEFSKRSLNLKVIEAFTHKNNLASIALLKKFNFTFQADRKCNTYDFNRIYKLEIN